MPLRPSDWQMPSWLHFHLPQFLPVQRHTDNDSWLSAHLRALTRDIRHQPVRHIRAVHPIQRLQHRWLASMVGARNGVETLRKSDALGFEDRFEVADLDPADR